MGLRDTIKSLVGEPTSTLKSLSPGGIERRDGSSLFKINFGKGEQRIVSSPLVVTASDTSFLCVPTPSGARIFDGRGNVREVGEGEIMTVGRGDDNSLPIVGDERVSRNHLRISVNRGTTLVRDTSTYGNTKLDGIAPVADTRYDGGFGPFMISPESNRVVGIKLYDKESPLRPTNPKMSLFVGKDGQTYIEVRGERTPVVLDQYGQAQIALGLDAVTGDLTTTKYSPTARIASGIVLRIINGNIGIVEDHKGSCGVVTSIKYGEVEVNTEEMSAPPPSEGRARVATNIPSDMRAKPTDEVRPKTIAKEVVTDGAVWHMAGRDRTGRVIAVDLTPGFSTLKTHKEQFAGGDYGLVKKLPDGTVIAIVGDPVGGTGGRGIAGVQRFLEMAYAGVSQSNDSVSARQAVLDALGRYHRSQANLAHAEKGSFTVGVVTIGKQYIDQWMFGDAGWIIGDDGNTYPRKTDVRNYDPVQLVCPDTTKDGRPIPYQVGFDDPGDSGWLHVQYPTSMFAGGQFVIMTDAGIKLSAEEIRQIFRSDNPALAAAEAGSRHDHAIAVHGDLRAVR